MPKISLAVSISAKLSYHIPGSIPPIRIHMHPSTIIVLYFNFLPTKNPAIRAATI